MEVLVTKWFKVFLCDERTGKVLDSGLISKDTQVVAERLASVQRGTLLDEERELVASVNGKVAVASTDSWSVRLVEHHFREIRLQRRAHA